MSGYRKIVRLLRSGDRDSPRAASVEGRQYAAAIAGRAPLDNWIRLRDARLDAQTLTIQPGTRLDDTAPAELIAVENAHDGAALFTGRSRP